VKPLLLPVLERSVRSDLERRGFVTSMQSTSLGRVHVYDARGTGRLPTVVFLHGLAATATGYAPVLLGLKERARRVEALDYLGHGFSEDPTSRLTSQRLVETTAEVLARVLQGEPAVPALPGR
jgi:pimeloyl-ACP methyl ester carboxylesterase